MPATLAALLPILRLFADAGAGALAYLLIDAMRRHWPLPAVEPATRWRRWLYIILHAPRWTRMLAIVLAGLIALPASLLLASAEGRPLLPVADALLASLISQIWHAVAELSGLPSAYVAERQSALARRMEAGYHIGDSHQ